MDLINETLDANFSEKTPLWDIKILISDRTFYVHKNIISSNCDYFKRMFYGQMKESREQTTEIKECNPEEMDLFLRFLYKTTDIIDALLAIKKSSINILEDAVPKFRESKPNLNVLLRSKIISKIVEKYLINYYNSIEDKKKNAHKVLIPFFYALDYIMQRICVLIPLCDKYQVAIVQEDQFFSNPYSTVILYLEEIYYGMMFSPEHISWSKSFPCLFGSMLSLLNKSDAVKKRLLCTLHDVTGVEPDTSAYILESTLTIMINYTHTGPKKILESCRKIITDFKTFKTKQDSDPEDDSPFVPLPLSAEEKEKLKKEQMIMEVYEKILY